MFNAGNKLHAIKHTVGAGLQRDYAAVVASLEELALWPGETGSHQSHAEWILRHG